MNAKQGLARHLGLAWGFSEAVFFFIVPDVWITWTALESFQRSWQQLLRVLLGSLVGGTLMFMWATRDPSGARAAVEKVPFVSAEMFQKTELDLAHSGALALCKGPMSGIPYKVYAVLAPPHMGLAAFLIVSVPARLERMALSWLGFAGLAALLRRWRPDLSALGRVGHALFWILTYLFYWGLI